LVQNGLARILAEIKTNNVLAPGILSLGTPENSFGYSGFINPIIQPDKFNINELKSNFSITWNNGTNDIFLFTLHPFYPSYIPAELAFEDFRNYVEEFLTLSNLDRQIFMLPVSFLGSNLLDSVLDTDCSLFSLIGLQRLFSNQRKLAYILTNLREKLPPDIALYLPGPIPPSYYSFLVYSGIDFFDDGLSSYVSSKGFFLTKDGHYKVSSHPTCYCSHCLSNPPNLEGHNKQVILNTIAEIRYALENNQLRTIVERDSNNSVIFNATLRHFDLNYSGVFISRFPLRISSELNCASDLALFHPAIEKYRERIKTRYQPQKHVKIVILFPCSAKKPYSISRSHILFRKALKAAKINQTIVDELIITSPLGVVPRDLENIYPARFYDIPVVGYWSKKEIDIAYSMLKNIIAKYEKKIILINHMHGHGYEDIWKRIQGDFDFEYYETAKDSSPTSKESLSNLINTLKGLSESIKNYQMGISEKKAFIKKLIAIADFQYGYGTGHLLFPPNSKLKGRFPYNQQIYTNGKFLGTLRGADGFLSLSIEGAQRIVNASKVKLYLSAKKIIGSNIYAPGVVKADEEILPLDEIFVVNEENVVIGTGISLIAGRDINKMHSGIVAKVKKKRRNENENK